MVRWQGHGRVKRRSSSLNSSKGWLCNVEPGTALKNIMIIIDALMGCGAASLVNTDVPKAAKVVSKWPD